MISYGRAVAKIVCLFPFLGSGDTLVQYAACLFGFPLRGEPAAQFDSDYSGGEGASILLSRQVCV